VMWKPLLSYKNMTEKARRLLEADGYWDRREVEIRNLYDFQYALNGFVFRGSERAAAALLWNSDVRTVVPDGTVQAVAEIFDETAATAFGLVPDGVVVTIHCGSRGLGHQVCSEFLKEIAGAANVATVALPDRELACAPINSEVGQRYLGAMRAAVNCALANREILGHFTRRHTRLVHLTDESITKTVDRPNEPRLRGVVVEGATDFGDQTREVGLEHERRGPQTLVKLLFRHGAIAVRHEQKEQLERLGRKRHLSPVAQKLSCCRIERK